MEQSHIRYDTYTAHLRARSQLSARTDKQSLGIAFEILECLAAQSAPMKRQEIARWLSISAAVTYRLISVLEQRGYVVADTTGGYRITPKLTDLRLSSAPLERLLIHAAPAMCALSDQTHQSCNLTVPTAKDLCVIAHQDSPGPFDIHIPVGFWYDRYTSAPGRAYAAALRTTRRQPSGGQGRGARPNAIAGEPATAQARNPFLPTVTDLSCAIFEKSECVAILSIPYIGTLKGMSLDSSLTALQTATENLSAVLSDERMALPLPF